MDIRPDDGLFDPNKPSEWRVYSVCELTREIRSSLEEGFPPLAVEGEISNFKRHTSGHLYFSLKDAEAQISCVLWRGRAGTLAFQPSDGARVLAFGAVTLYERQGRLQLDVQWLRPLGAGALQAAFEALKRRLAAEGLFDGERKRPLPAFPRRIGLVTSETGAALRDLVSVIGRRAPWVECVLRPVRVQGPGAAEDIAQAIRDFNDWGGADVLIVGRGGGSLEDLWAFNEESVARAIAGSGIPVVSAVGHEVDFSISDFVADLRAPTPSAAAELVARDGAEIDDRVRNSVLRLARNARNRLSLSAERLDALVNRYGLRRPGDRLREFRQRLDDSVQSLGTAAALRIQSLRAQAGGTAGKLAALNPDAVLARGYSVTTRIRDGRIVSRAADLGAGESVRIRFASGAARANVETTEP